MRNLKQGERESDPKIIMYREREREREREIQTQTQTHHTQYTLSDLNTEETISTTLATEIKVRLQIHLSTHKHKV